MEKEAKEFSNESSGRFKRQQAELGSLFSMYPALNTWYQIDENQPPYLPPDFHGRLAIHIMILMEKHTSTETIQKVSELLQRHINTPKMYVVLFKVLRLFTHKIETAGFLATIWRAMLSKSQPDEQSLFQVVMRWMIDDYTHNRLRNFYTDEERKEFKFSFLAFEMGDHLISLYDTPAKNIDLIREIYTTIIDLVFENVSITDEIAKKNSMLMSGDFSGTKELPYFDRLIFSDIYDYVDYRATSSGQNNYHNMGIQHSSDSIKTLLKQLASIRVQYTQSLIREKTVQRNQALKKKLERKNLSEEEMITCTPYFYNALRFFYLEKRYNFDVYNISLARYFLQFFTVLLGSLPLLYSFLDTENFSLVKGFAIFLISCVFAQLMFNKKYFRRAFPNKNYIELENFTEQFLFYFQKMMPDQLRVFGVQQIKMAENKEYFPLIPEFLLFLYRSIPKKDRALVSYLDVINVNQYLTGVILNNLGPELDT